MALKFAILYKIKRVKINNQLLLCEAPNPPPRKYCSAEKQKTDFPFSLTYFVR